LSSESEVDGNGSSGSKCSCGFDYYLLAFQLLGKYTIRTGIA
jgi:hypothetical protein